MNWDEEYREASNRAKLDLSEVVWYRLAGSFLATEDGNVCKQTCDKSENSPSEAPVFEKASRIRQGQTEDAAPEQPLESQPKEEDDIMEGFWKAEVRSIKSTVEELKKSQKILNAICMALFFLVTICVALMGSKYWGGKSPQALSQDGVAAAQALIIKGPNGQGHAFINERDGMFWLELRDAAGKAQASISLTPSSEPKLTLFDKDQKKLGELGEAEVKPATIENTAEPATSPAVSERANVPQEIASPVKYIGSKTSNKYHYPECKWGKQIVPEKLLGFHSVKEAQDSGYAQCRACQPPLSDKPDEAIQTAARE